MYVLHYNVYYANILTYILFQIICNKYTLHVLCTNFNICIIAQNEIKKLLSLLVLLLLLLLLYLTVIHSTVSANDANNRNTLMNEPIGAQ